MKRVDVDILGGIFRDFVFYGDVHATDLLEIPGGTGYDVYIGLRTLGIGAAFHGSVGYDWPFEKVGAIIENKKSGIFISRNETEVLAVYRGANLYTSFQSIQSSVLFATLECGGELFVKYATDAKNKNAIVIVDPVPILEWRKKYLDLIDVIIPNEAEYKVISKDEFPSSITLFEKLGEEGGRYIKGNTTYYIPIKINGVFPLGCGDAFDVAVVNGILKHYSPFKTLKKAVYAGSNASLVKGSSTAVVKAIEKIV